MDNLEFYKPPAAIKSIIAEILKLYAIRLAHAGPSLDNDRILQLKSFCLALGNRLFGGQVQDHLEYAMCALEILRTREPKGSEQIYLIALEEYDPALVQWRCCMECKVFSYKGETSHLMSCSIFKKDEEEKRKAENLRCGRDADA